MRRVASPEVEISEHPIIRYLVELDLDRPAPKLSIRKFKEVVKQP